MASAASIITGSTGAPRGAMTRPRGLAEDPRPLRRGNRAGEPRPFRVQRRTFPTALVAAESDAMRLALLRCLPQAHCLVLEADSQDRVLEILVGHSRPIHVLLLDAGIADPTFTALPKRYRSGLEVVIVAGCSDSPPAGALAIKDAVLRAREIIQAAREASKN
jgi:hypothetical protein